MDQPYPSEFSVRLFPDSDDRCPSNITADCPSYMTFHPHQSDSIGEISGFSRKFSDSTFGARNHPGYISQTSEGLSAGFGSLSESSQDMSAVQSSSRIRSDIIIKDECQSQREFSFIPKKSHDQDSRLEEESERAKIQSEPFE